MCQGTCTPRMCQLIGSHKPVQRKLQRQLDIFPALRTESRTNYTQLTLSPNLHPNTDKFTQVQQVVTCPDFQGNAQIKFLPKDLRASDPLSSWRQTCNFPWMIDWPMHWQLVHIVKFLETWTATHSISCIYISLSLCRICIYNYIYI